MDLVESRVLLFKSDFTMLGLFFLHKDQNDASLFLPLPKGHSKALLFLQFSQVMMAFSQGFLLTLSRPNFEIFQNPI